DAARLLDCAPIEILLIIIIAAQRQINKSAPYDFRGHWIERASTIVGFPSNCLSAANSEHFNQSNRIPGVGVENEITPCRLSACSMLSSVEATLVGGLLPLFSQYRTDRG